MAENKIPSKKMGVKKFPNLANFQKNLIFLPSPVYIKLFTLL